MSISIVQQKSASGSGDQTVTPDSAWTDGNWIVVSIRSSGGGGGGVVSGVSGGGVSSWSHATERNASSGSFVANVYYGQNSGGGSASITVDCVSSSSTVVNVCELSGLASSPFVGDNGAADSTYGGTTISTGSVSPTAGDEIILFSCIRSQGGIEGSPSGYSHLTGSNASSWEQAMYQIVSSASGSYSATWTIGSWTIAAVILAVFKGGLPPVDAAAGHPRRAHQVVGGTAALGALTAGAATL